MDVDNLKETILITNKSERTFYDELSYCLSQCNSFMFSVAFVNFSGMQLLLDDLKLLEERGVEGKIITSTYLNFTDSKSLEKLTEFSNIKTNIYEARKGQGFHTKGYIFEFEDCYKIIIGSSNITQAALKYNYEWNVRCIDKKDSEFVNSVISEFNSLWNIATVVNEKFIEQYKLFLDSLKSSIINNDRIFRSEIEIEPNSMQLKALANLDSLRKNNQEKALVIAATGTGKTYLSAFDVKNVNAKRVLFVVHREVILDEASKSFMLLHRDKSFTIFKGQNKDRNSDFTFAMVQTISKDENLKLFPKNHFDYIIIDEAHRSFSCTYKKIIDYFSPKFLLGMTATPERTDGGNIFELYNNNIALEVRLRDALKEQLVIPFHYFGITDATTDISDKDSESIDVLARKLSIKDRVDLIIEKLLFYGYSGRKRKCLGFCVSKEHAKYMSDEFNSWGFESTYLTGESTDRERKNIIKRLENDKDKLEFVFTIDIFNEGVDIQSINLVLMLRPTQSPIIFTQQLGRGLRKHFSKEFLTVLDFIGNHKKSFLIPVALSGSRYHDRDSLKVQVFNNFKDIPGCTNIKLDKIVKDQILNQLERVNFNDKKYLKQEYNEFKKTLAGRTPIITDHLLFENAPDPIRFILSEKSYNGFVSKVDKENSEKTPHIEIQQLIDRMIPIKRIHEFVILKLLFKGYKVDFELAKKEIGKIVVNVDDDSIKHSIRYLSGDFYSDKEINKFNFITSENNVLRILDSKLIEENMFILYSLDYGILRYQDDFGKQGLEYPYLQKYKYYKMQDMGLLSNYTKTFSSIRGSGVWSYGNHIYLFVDLHKEDVKESIDYKDKILSKKQMQWQSQNKTSQTSNTGLRICHNKDYDIHLHMFLRKAKKIENIIQDYMYVGEVNPIDFHGNKPITFKMEFVNELTEYVYNDLTQVISTER